MSWITYVNDSGVIVSEDIFTEQMTGARDYARSRAGDDHAILTVSYTEGAVNVDFIRSKIQVRFVNESEFKKVASPDVMELVENAEAAAV